MIRLIRVLPAAESDLIQIKAWYDARRPGLGDEFLLSAKYCAYEVSVMPESNRIYFRDFRRALIHRFPYKIFYREIGQEIVIFRILHAKQSHHPNLG